jgi:hypothetical protein
MPPDQRHPFLRPLPESPLSLPWRKGAPTLEEPLRRQSKNPTFSSMRKRICEKFEKDLKGISKLARPIGVEPVNS